MKYRKHRVVSTTVSWISLLLLVGTLFPAITRADVWDLLIPIRPTSSSKDSAVPSSNLQTMELPQPANNINPSSAIGGGDVSIVDNTAVIAQDGPSGTIADIEKPRNGTISTYVVREGDTLSSIAKLFDIPQNTILWANDLTSKSTIKPGDKLIILPVPGLKYTVKKGDTLASIAKRYNADSGDIAGYNNISDDTLVVGEEIIIPDGEPTIPPAPAKPLAKKTSKTTSAAHDVGPKGSAGEVSYYMATAAMAAMSSSAIATEAKPSMLTCPRSTPTAALAPSRARSSATSATPANRPAITCTLRSAAVLGIRFSILSLVRTLWGVKLR
ncbi:LysM peptidoglycan-binding domain-containing protein [Candidatus Kaiserbacteria bacterium]|nr:LysM peptidoglycan-binding domain-containing protein [Candidatus Kaiserbacteria bacterium]